MFAMLIEFLNPTKFILSILGASLITSFVSCKLSNKSFFNPKLYSYNYIVDKTKTVLTVGAQCVVNYNIIYYSVSQYHLHSNTIDIQSRIFQNIKFLLVLEFIAYWYHRLSHEITYIYKNFHYEHHLNINIHPIDFLQIDYIDNTAHTLYMNLPLLVVPMNTIDYSVFYYIYTTGGFIVHSDIVTSDHVIHHKMFKYNFGLLFPIFDVLFGTYKA